MTRFFLYHSGRLFGTRYLFEQTGDGIPMHSHPAITDHNIIVLNGTVEIYGPRKFWSRTRHAGSVFDFDQGGAHEIRALTDGAEILNLYLQGMPDEYRHIPVEDFSGVLNYADMQNFEP